VRGPSDDLFSLRRGAPALRAAAPLAAAALIGAAAWAQEPAFTLSEALRLAARSSVQADTAALNAQAAREESGQIKSLYYPQVTLDGGHVNLDNDPFFKFGPTVFPAGEQVYWKYDIAVREVLWDGGRRSAALSASRTREQAVELSGATQVRQAQEVVAERYVGVLSLADQRRVVDLRKKALEDHLRVVKDLFDQGMVARNDLLRTEVALRSVDDQASSLDAAEATAKEALNQALGAAPTTPRLLPQSLPPPPPLPWDEAAVRRLAVENNDAVKAMEARCKAMEESVVLRQREYMPTVIAELGHSYAQNRYMLYPHVTSLFVGLSFDVFDGGARSAKIRQSQREAEAARRELRDLRAQVEVAGMKALRDFDEALKESRTAQANVEAALENLRIVEDQYKEGLAKTTDVLDAETVLAESRFSLARARYQAYARQAALLAVLGQDLPAFYDSMQKEP
jgi:outer membrane protein